MQGNKSIATSLSVLTVGLAVCLFTLAYRARAANQQVSPDQQKRIDVMRASGSPMRVGTFDSRAVALAYYRSKPFGRVMKKLKDDFEQAKAAGDEKRAAELEVQGPAQQALMRRQGFGTASVADILKKIEKKIPKIAKQANVAVIVSKWDITYQRSAADFVDVTELLVQPFDPDEKTQKIIKEIQKQEPVPLEELEGHQD